MLYGKSNVAAVKNFFGLNDKLLVTSRVDAKDKSYIDAVFGKVAEKLVVNFLVKFVKTLGLET